MVYFTSPPNENKTQFHVVRWLGWRVAALGARLFAVPDRTAIQHGWVITRRHGGLARSYRDPRFGWLLPCPRCAGRGGVDGEPCLLCDATGRVTRAPRLEGQSP